MTRPTLDEVLTAKVYAVASAWESGGPARVERYDAEAHTVDVLPLLQREDPATGEARSRPVLPGVPVHSAAGSGGAFVVELAKGDVVWLLHASRSMAAWREGDPASEAPSPRRPRFPLGSAIALPFMPGAAAVSSPAQVRIGADGTVAIGNGTVDLVATLRELIDLLTGGGVVDPQSGALAPLVDSLLAPLQARLEAMSAGLLAVEAR